MRYVTIRRLVRLIRNTPLHPQWLLEDKRTVAHWVRGLARGTVLDIGCADRWVQNWLPPPARYVGLDYPATGAELYHARPDVFGDASNLPFQNDSFDTVVLLEVYEHLSQPGAALQQIKRVLRPSGRLLLSMPFLYPIHDAPHDFQRLTVHGLTRDIETAGFSIDSIEPVLSACKTAGLITCIALAGVGLRSVQTRSLGMVLIPVILVAIPMINILAWVGSKLLPGWDAVTSGYRVCAVKPAVSAQS